jgi:uncharacterized protein involved in exopolysaccharide biosynthesis
MLRRALDVVFQHLGRLLAGIVLVPLVVGAVALAFTWTDVVSARLWADRPAVTNGVGGQPTDPTAADFDPSVPPAQRQATLLSELVQTNTFMARAFRSQPAARVIDRSRRQSLEQSVRSGFRAQAAGTNVVTLSFTTTRSGDGIALMKSIISAYGQTLVDLQVRQAEATAGTLDEQLATAKQEMDEAVSKVQAYAQSHHLSPAAGSDDPMYSSLATTAQGKTSAYLDLLDKSREQQNAQEAAAGQLGTLFHVVDSPSASAQPVDAQSPAARFAMYGLWVILALEIVFVYHSVRRDPRVRTATEVARVLSIRSLGSVPMSHVE